MKRKVFTLILFSFLLFAPKVSAQEIYYQNKNGVILSKEEYDFLTYMFWDGCQSLMTYNDYIKFINSNIMNGTLDTNIYDETLTRASSVEYNNRTLKISKSCASNCFISVTLTWKNNPTVKSYDVMGAYLDGTSLVNQPSTIIGQTSYSDIKKENNGFGVSILLPWINNSMVINQTYRVSKGGTVYASYQHAKSNISQANSKNYTFSKAGYGGVFKFSGVAASTYDRMNGVSIDV